MKLVPLQHGFAPFKRQVIVARLDGFLHARACADDAHFGGRLVNAQATRAISLNESGVAGRGRGWNHAGGRNGFYLAAARTVIERYWGPRLQSMSGPLRDAKTELQEWAHRRGLETPLYFEVLRSGPDHAPEFEIEVKVPGVSPERARGRSKREAEHEAAAAMLRREGVWAAA